MLAIASACAPPRSAVPAGTLVVSREQTASFVRNFNPLLVTGGVRWPTRNGIYEPLAIFNSAQGEWVPWLATGWTWHEESRGLDMQIREGVQWSDGEPLHANDVVYTYMLLREHPALDSNGTWDFLESVVATDAHTVVFRFQRPNVPGLRGIAHQPIVPAHIWSEVEDPVGFTNPEPVGTGPFTEILRFSPQVWELGRNPNYWQPGRPAVEVLRFPAFPANDQANMALIHGEVDWAGNFVPAIDRIFVGADPAHHGYWFPTVGGTVFLYPNTTVPPLDQPEVRKALSLAIDRGRVVEVGMADYVPASTGVGLSDGFAAWRDPAAEAAADWVDHDPIRAGEMLDAAGWTMGPDGVRIDAHGAPLRLDIIVPAGWSDWVRSTQVLSRNLQAVGVDARVDGMDFAAWFQAVTKGEFALSPGWSIEDPEPFAYFDGLMGQGKVLPVGESAPTNWHRYGDPVVDRLVDQAAATPDQADRLPLAHELQRRFADAAPAIPLFPNPSWGEYNSRRFTGFPNADDPYARLSPNHEHEPLLVMVRLEPR